MNWKAWGGVAVIVLALAGWRTYSNLHRGADPAESVQACITKYALPAATQRIVAVTRDICETAYAPQTDAIERRRLLCYAEAAPKVQVEAGMNLAMQQCDQRYPHPDAKTCAANEVEIVDPYNGDRSCQAKQGA